MMEGPLAGVRVIDLTTVAMGPYATQILGDMGADVIKVESGSGDVFRQASPMKSPNMGAAFLNLNRNKRSVVIDLKSGQGRLAFLKLVAEADVLVFNLRPQSMKNLGLTYEELQLANPRLVYCGAYGFSEKGRYAGRPAFDDVVQAMCGIASLQGITGRHVPSYVNTIMADKCAGLTVAYSIAMALFEREKSGLGQAIEVPMFETLVSFTLVEHLAGETFVPPLGPTGYQRVLSEHRKPYRAKDGYVSILPYTDRHWLTFFEIAGEQKHLADERFKTMTGRSKNINELYEILASVVATRTVDEWQKLLGDSDIPVAPVMSIDDLISDSHLFDEKFFSITNHDSEGRLRNIGIPVSFSRTPGSIRRPAPRLGEHTAEIVGDLFAAPIKKGVEEN
ncbi:crotonobetainyl-CoA:carnitine CoA-transferase CaiB-like acyl-CoA transferase [Caballeronia udeis]|uniref:Crotonobetainyl-CoA:carnitine CoA-transferase CaiB-like acyl-CoA transferase n=2 Tax=Caballeronia udeis TaxID=1232866 RepID=A0ABW8MQT8_9BURK